MKFRRVLFRTDGIVASSVTGLMELALVTRNEVEEALVTLAAPDVDSRTKDDEGRRIKDVDGGWKILNHRKYRDLRTETQVAIAERVRKHREKIKTEIGRRRAVGENRLRILLKIIRRKHVVFRRNECLKEMPGAPGGEAQALPLCSQ